MIGPFARAGRPIDATLETRLRRAAAAAELRWLEPATLETRLTGLVAEHYDQTREWTVGEYLHASGDAQL